MGNFHQSLKNLSNWSKPQISPQKTAIDSGLRNQRQWIKINALNSLCYSPFHAESDDISYIMLRLSVFENKWGQS